MWHRVISSPDEQWVRELAGRSANEAGAALAQSTVRGTAILVSGGRRPLLAGLDMPTLVLHGEADPMSRLAGGQGPRSRHPRRQGRYCSYPGMGYDLLRPL